MTSATCFALLFTVFVVSGIAGLSVGYVLARRVAAKNVSKASASAAQQQALAVQQAKLDAQEKAQLLREELTAAQTRATGLEDRLRDAQKESQERGALGRDQQRVLQQLTPLQHSLSKLEHTVANIEQQRATQHGELAEQLRQAARAEEQLRGTAQTLASALSSNTTRGFWGETQLRRIIEAAGMIEHVDFSVQQHITTEQGTVRPDMIVHLPGGKSIAIDAKVPFDSYLRAQQHQQASTPDTTQPRHALLAAHAKALREHVVALSSREYWRALTESPEMVIAFIPSESLLSSALDTDPLLLEYAFGRRVALASPVSLWAILTSIAHTWRQESLTHEARTLYELSREFHHRLSRTASHLDKLGRTLSRSVQDYNAYVGSLERQVLPSVRKISALSKENIGMEPVQLEEAVRPLIAPELRPDSNPEADTDTGSEPDTGADTGTGASADTEPDTSAKTGTGTGNGSKPDTSAETGTGTGNGSEPDTATGN